MDTPITKQVINLENEVMKFDQFVDMDKLNTDELVKLESEISAFDQFIRMERLVLYATVLSTVFIDRVGQDVKDLMKLNTKTATYHNFKDLHHYYAESRDCYNWKETALSRWRSFLCGECPVLLSLATPHWRQLHYLNIDFSKLSNTLSLFSYHLIKYGQAWLGYVCPGGVFYDDELDVDEANKPLLESIQYMLAFAHENETFPYNYKLVVGEDGYDKWKPENGEKPLIYLYQDLLSIFQQLLIYVTNENPAKIIARSPALMEAREKVRKKGYPHLSKKLHVEGYMDGGKYF